jgi:formate dehydrogenase subunit gamma
MSTGTITRAGTTTPEGQILRYNFVERAMHWITAIAYVYCMVTGLAMFTPYMFWMGDVLGGGANVRFWHPWVGLVYLATAFWMNAQWKGDMKPIPEDEAWDKNVKYYVENLDDKMPPQGRFNAGQKMYWKGMFWSSLVLLVTGIVMWFPELISQKPSLRGLHWILPVCVFFHCVAALVTIGLFIIHVYMSVWMTPGSMKAMMDGNVSTRWARTHHRLWYEKMTGRKG